jgi:hypothetical protein
VLACGHFKVDRAEQHPSNTVPHWAWDRSDDRRTPLAARRLTRRHSGSRIIERQRAESAPAKDGEATLDVATDINVERHE